MKERETYHKNAKRTKFATHIQNDRAVYLHLLYFNLNAMPPKIGNIIHTVVKCGRAYIKSSTMIPVQINKIFEQKNQIQK